MKTTPTKTYTYLGARAERYEVREAGPAGRRAIVHRWLDKAIGQATEHEPGTITIRFVRGDGNKGTLVEIAPEVVLEPGTDAGFVSDYVTEVLG